jgi:pimeloyl-ACP methyl ester carboxylesterase
MTVIVPVERRVEVGELLPGEGRLSVAADIYRPPRLRSPPTALFCLPGGALTRRYFDLRPDHGAQSVHAPQPEHVVRPDPRPDSDHPPWDFSFAQFLAARGFIVITLDPLGVGGSSRPRDGFELTPDVLTKANAIALDSIRADLRTGALPAGAQPLEELRTVGVGHSMGAMLTVLQQARDRQHRGLMLFGYGTRGLAPALSPEEATFAADPAGARQNVVRLARARSTEPYPVINSSEGRGLFAGKGADRRGVEALQSARTELLVTAGLFAMIPGSSAPECARLEIPIFLGLGDRDIAGPPHEIPASFPASPDVTLLVLPSTGHCHFLFASRQHLFARAASWLEAIMHT